MAENKQKNQRKYSRNRKSGQNTRYKAENRHAKSHVRRIKKHIQRYACVGHRGFTPIISDRVAEKALLFYAEQIGLRAVQDAKQFLGLRDSKVAA